MRLNKEIVGEASEVYAKYRHPARWDGEPWGEAGRANHELAIKEVLKWFNKQLKVGGKG